MQDHDYGIDWDGPIGMDDDSNTVIVPSLPEYLITEDQEKVLKEELVNHQDDKFGIEHCSVKDLHFELSYP